MLGVEDEEEDLDDTHLCIKCNRTIIGLQNYIKHRKEKSCNPNKATLTTLNRVQNETPYTDRMATDSFSFNYPGDTPKAHETSADVKLPSENLEYNYDLGADFFFSSLELQSSSKRNPIKPSHDHRVLTRKTTAAIMSSHHEVHDDDWIPQQDHQDESEKLMKAVSEIGDLKKDDPIFHKVEFPQESAESSSEEEEDIDEFAPPKNHTGGKWKPSDPSIPESSPWRSQTHWDDPDDPEDQEDDFFSPPSNHTKGKWIPGSKITKLDYKTTTTTTTASSSKTPIWCHTCNRKLASQQMYDRHLKTNLHKRKSMPEIELAHSFGPQKSRMSDYAQEMFEKGLIPTKKEATIPPKVSSRSRKEKEVKRLRRKIYSRCDVCRLKMRHHLMGKHLISHYHYRRMNLQPEKSLTAVLSNIHRIVLQSPFQCQPCRFYANTEEAFMAHWNSSTHQETVANVKRLYCSFCKFECTDNAAMTLHLTGVDHQEVVYAINRSVPIVIREKIIIKCETCSAEFRYNMELRRHAAFCQPLAKESSGSDSYQSKFICELCSMVFKSKRTLQRHERSQHNKFLYFCSLCGKDFETAQLAKAHRQTSEHKVESAKASGKTMNRFCSLCGEILPDLSKLKEHLREIHPNRKYSCSQCGESFVFSQELAAHSRTTSCSKKSKPDKHTYEIIFKCDLCGGVFNNRHELRSHVDQTHAVEKDLQQGKSKPSAFSCKHCDKVFKTRFLLEQHLHVHRDKEPCMRFVCPHEGCSFTGRTMGEVSLHTETHSSEKKFECPIENCNYKGTTLRHLKRHQTLQHGTRKEFKCPDCEYSTTSSSHLKRHQRIHTNERPYQCPYCNYAAQTSDNLTKHMKSKAHKSLDDQSKKPQDNK